MKLGFLVFRGLTLIESRRLITSGVAADWSASSKRRAEMAQSVGSVRRCGALPADGAVGGFVGDSGRVSSFLSTPSMAGLPASSGPDSFAIQARYSKSATSATW